MWQVVQRVWQAASQAWSDIVAQSRDTGSPHALLRVFVVAGCALTAIPATALLVRELALGDTTAVAILIVALVIIAFNLFAARLEPYPLWPSRLMVAFAIFMIGHGVWFGGDQVRLIWPLVLPPLVLFVYGRKEGSFWTFALFLPCVAYLGTGAVDTGSATDFVLAYLFSTLCAFVFQGLHAASRRELAAGEAALRGAAQKFQDFAEIDSDWFFELDEQYRIKSATGDLLRLVGAKEKSVVGRNILDLTHLLSPVDPGNLSRLAAALESRTSLRSSRFALTSQGKPVYIDISIKPYFDEATQTAGFRGVASNVTDSVRQEAELHEKQRALYRAQKMEAVGQLTSGLAHDLNNILTVIGGNLDLLRHCGQLDDQERRYTTEAIDAAARASELMSALLAFARQQPLEPTDCDLSTVFAQLKPLLRRALGETYELDVFVPDGLWSVHVDAAQLESSLLNLGLNARDAMPQGGRLVVDCCNEQVDAKEETLAPGGYVRISVRDTGAGIPEEIQGLIFDPFFTTKGVNEGSGLGLSMVFGFARQSHGDIRLERTSEAGTTFALYLPRGIDSERKEIDSTSNSAANVA